MTDPIRILMGSDFHFGISTVNQEDMARAFADTIFPLLAETDIFFINGDFFDTLVIFDNHGFNPIYDVIMDLFSLCDHHQVKLRILQGTWMHDRNQCRRFETFYRKSGYTFDFRFAENIELEEIAFENRSLKILYVPDDLPFKSSDDILTVIETKLVEKGWDSIDYACMHGFFDFTFPKGIKQDNVVVFKESQFPFVKKMIDVGHVHQNRTQGKVISNGSFDRLCFGDEESKGLIRIQDYSDHYTAQFIENKDTAVYDTLVFTKEDTTESIRTRIDAHLSALMTKRKISLRCIIDSLDHREAIKDWMKEVHPDVRCVIKQNKDINDQQILMIPSSILFTPVEKRIAPTPKTIASFVRAHIPEDYVLSLDDISHYLEPGVG